MRLEEKINEKLKVAMKSKDKISLESLRLIKSEILLLKTKSRLLKFFLGCNKNLQNIIK